MEKPDDFNALHRLIGGRDQSTAVDSALLALLDLSVDGMCLVDPTSGDISYANAALRNWISQSGAPTLEGNLAELLPGAEAATVLERLRRVATGESGGAALSSRIVTRSGDERPVELTARPVESDGQSLLAIVVRQVSTSAAASRDGGQTDPLTGLADRAFLMERLNSLVRGGRSRDHQCAVLFIDVDGFKQVNDAYGHLVGDHVLCEVARRLAECVRSDDHVARFGGDEFVVVLENVRDRDEIQPVVDRISAAFDRPVALPQGDVRLTVSVGVAQAEGQTAEQLLDAADRAMYAAKRAAT